MQIKDDRTAEQRKSHNCLIVGTDRFMSGWGSAPGTSYAAWACEEGVAGIVENWVRNRRDQMRVRVVYDSPQRRYRPRGGDGDHLHIYVVGPNHPSIAYLNQKAS